MKRNDLITILALTSIKGISSVAIKKLWHVGIFKNQDPYEEVNQCLEILKKQQSELTVNACIDDAVAILNRSSSDDIKLVSISDKDYPRKMAELKNPPSVIFYKGNFDLTEKTIGVIGTREPNETGKIIAGRIGQFFTEKGFSIVNGLALGIDRESIQFNGNYHSKVIGIMAGGLNYNQEKTLLKSTALEAEKVLESGGLLLSEYSSGFKEDTFSVVKSCRIQAAISDGLILIQSKLNGGSKFTIEPFSELARPLGIIKPIEREKDLQLYEANLEIIGNNLKGISKMTGVKLEKIRINHVEVIADKLQYDSFSSLIDTNNNQNRIAGGGDLFHN